MKSGVAPEKMLILLSVCTLALVFRVQSVACIYHRETIHVRTDGGVDPLELVSTITLDKEPESIVVNEETNSLYVGVEGGLRVIDTETNELKAEVPLNFTAEVLAINPQTNRIFVSGKETPDFATYVIDCNTNMMVGEIAHQADESYELAINPTTNRVYISLPSGITGLPDRVGVYDGETFMSEEQVPIPGSGDHPYIERVGITVNPETNRIYATWSGEHTVHAIDGNTNEVLESVSLAGPYWSDAVIINSFTNYVYVGKAVLDGETLVEVTSDYQGYLQAVDPLHNLLYTTDLGGYLYVLNGTTHEMLASLELDKGISCLAVNPKTGKIYLAHGSTKQISVVIPEFPVWTSILLALFLLAVSVTIYKRRHACMQKGGSASHLKMN